MNTHNFARTMSKPDGGCRFLNRSRLHAKLVDRGYAVLAFKQVSPSFHLVTVPQGFPKANNPHWNP